MRVEEGAFSSRLLAGGEAPAARVRVLEVLRSKRALDAVLEKYSRRKLRKLDAEIRAVLRIGLVETMNLDVPPAIATDGAVHLSRRLGKASASGMVNAVLRRASSAWKAVLESSPIDVRLSHPEWLYRRWAEQLGQERAEGAMASAQEPAVTWAWFLDDDARRRLRDHEVDLEPHPWCPGAWSAPHDAASLVKTVSDGAAYAQDPSSQLVSHVATSLSKGATDCLDLCAAPGGKAALMLSLGEWKSAVAADLRLNRVRLMRPQVKRAGTCATVAADALRPPFAPGGWDFVLLDAPCTGTGTFRRHPELKWRLDPESVITLVLRQRDLLASAVQLVAPGGALLYTTCSIEPEENEGVVRDLPAGFEIENLEPHLPPGVPWLPTAAGGIRILPNPHGDGFTMHAVRRR